MGLTCPSGVRQMFTNDLHNDVSSYASYSLQSNFVSSQLLRPGHILRSPDFSMYARHHDCMELLFRIVKSGPVSEVRFNDVVLYTHLQVGIARLSVITEKCYMHNYFIYSYPLSDMSRWC